MKDVFVLRTIRKGKVSIFHKVFAPDDRTLPYDGRLDGKRFAFGRYDPLAWKGRPEFVYMWGSEKAYKKGAETDWPGEACVDGTFHWEIWTEVTP